MKRLLALALTAAILGGCAILPVGYPVYAHPYHGYGYDGYRWHDHFWGGGHWRYGGYHH
jgi:hypothetical protein